MSTQVRLRRGTTAAHAAFTGALAEVTVDTDKKTAVVHDGGTAGGFPLAREDSKNDGALGYLQEVKTSDYAIGVGDVGKALIANKVTAITFTLGNAATLTSKFVAIIKNIGSGTLSLAPTGAELIDGVNAAVSIATNSSLIIKGDGSSFRTYVSNGDVTASAIHNATGKTTLADNDELGVIDSAASNVLKKVLFSNLIASIFTTARKIANAYFLTSFRLWDATDNTKGLSFDLSGITTATTRSLKMPDRNVELGYPIRAWVLFTGATGAIISSGNVTSVTRNGTGDYTVNFTNNMPDANYAAVPALVGNTASGADTIGVNATGGQTVSSVRLIAVRAASGVFDPTRVSLIVVE